jgi:hypothetical protein
MRWECRMPLLILLALSCHVPGAAALDWAPVTDAEKAMKSSPVDPGAGAVVLFKRGQIDILEKQSLFWTTRIQRYVRIKIFKEAGREAANVAVDAPKYLRVSKVEGRTILPSGQTIPLDTSQIFRGVAYKSGRHFAVMQTSFTLPSVEPGAIIEYQVEEIEDWFFPEPWIFDTEELGTLESSLRVVVGPRLGMNQFPLETTLSKISISRNHTVLGEQFDFSVQNLRPIVREPFALPVRDQATMVLFTPSELVFSNQIYPIITRWDDVAKEVSEEMAKMNQNDKQAKSKAKEIAEKLPDGRARAEAIYKYLQQNVTSSNLAGVYLGRSADEIVSSKRGDPDQINALLVTMLKEVKVDADLVLVAAQNWQTLARPFPNRSQFSRAISRVNLKEASVFADPADAAAPFGDLPWYERGVVGLAVKGSKVQEVPIPSGTPEDNLSVTKLSFKVDHDWDFEGEAQLELKGAEAIDYRGDLMDEAPDKLEQRLTDYLGFGHADATVSQITHPDLKDSSQPFVLKAHLREKLVDESGPGELLLNPWLEDEYSSPIFKASERHSAVRFHNPEKRVSSSTWQLTPEIKVEQLPKDVSIENDLGSFSHSCKQSGSSVTCTRTFVLKKMAIQDTKEYMSARKFFDDIAKEDKEVIVLRGQ